MVDHILQKTKVQKLDYVGHSQGVTTFLVMTSLRPQYQQYFRTVVAMSPVAFLANLPNQLLKFMASNSEKVELLLDVLGIYELLPSNQVNGLLANLLCRESSPSAELCANLLFLAIGPDPIHLNRVRNVIPSFLCPLLTGSDSPLDPLARDLPEHPSRHLIQAVPALRKPCQFWSLPALRLQAAECSRIQE